MRRIFYIQTAVVQAVCGSIDIQSGLFESKTVDQKYQNGKWETTEVKSKTLVSHLKKDISHPFFHPRPPI